MGAWSVGGARARGCVGAWARGCVGAWVRGCMGAWVRGRVGAWVLHRSICELLACLLVCLLIDTCNRVLISDLACLLILDL
jgi:hypothetical protein